MNALPTLRKRVLFRTELYIHGLLLPLRIWRADMRDILARSEPRSSSFYAGLDSAYIVRRVHKALRRPVMMASRRCLREGLLAYRFLRKAGYQPDLVFGVDAPSLQGTNPMAHCWVQLEGQDVLNPPDRAMTIVFRHPATSRIG